MSKIQFRLAARTDAAGKYNATAPLEGNEDNMFIDADLSNVEQGVFMADKVVDLTDKGCLMVVADGMGGMNAGEVASAIAIKTVMEYFDAEHMAAKSFRDSRSRMNYMEEVVVAADAAIKADAKMDKEHEGMGSTIIMAWLCDGEICLTWCGDSRAYLYRPGCGFWQVSKDHSYVQGLVDEGKITPDEAFDHPYGNIITRSLGDPEKKSKADSVNFDVYEGDIFMLCSDGLSGVLRDHKTFDENRQRIDTENLEDIIAANRASMAQCRDELFDAAQRNDWYDNVTAILCEIVSGDPIPADMKPPVQAASQPRLEQSNYTPQAPNPVQANNIRSSRISIRKKHLPLIIAAIVLLLGVTGFLALRYANRDKDNYSLEADNDMYNNCETSNDYRAYLSQYGKKGNHYKDAKKELEKMVNDSISLAEQTQTKTISNETTDNTTSPTTKKDDKKPRPVENTIVKEQRRRDSLEAEKKKLAEILTPSSSKDPNLTPAAQKVDSQEDTEKGKQDTNSEEEKAFYKINNKINNKTVTLSDCEEYLRVYYKKHPRGNLEHWSIVAGRFRLLYTSKINHSTIEELEEIIIKHDKYIKSLNLDGMPEYDKQMKDLANAKKKQLEKSKKN